MLLLQPVVCHNRTGQQAQMDNASSAKKCQPHRNLRRFWSPEFSLCNSNTHSLHLVCVDFPRFFSDFLFEAVKSEREGTSRFYLEAAEAFALSPVEFFHADNFSMKFAARVLLGAYRDGGDGVGDGGTVADNENKVSAGLAVSDFCRVARLRPGDRTVGVVSGVHGGRAYVMYIACLVIS